MDLKPKLLQKTMLDTRDSDTAFRKCTDQVIKDFKNFADLDTAMEDPPSPEPDEDYEPDYISAEDSPLLRGGLTHPFTFNVALETLRCMWINCIHNEVIFKFGETLVNSADTVHGGMNWNVAEPTTNFEYRASLHGVFNSVRYPRILDRVRLMASPDTYCPNEHFVYLSPKDMEEELESYHTKSLKLLAQLKIEEEKNFVTLHPKTLVLRDGYTNFGKSAVVVKPVVASGKTGEPVALEALEDETDSGVNRDGTTEGSSGGGSGGPPTKKAKTGEAAGNNDPQENNDPKGNMGN